MAATADTSSSSGTGIGEPPLTPASSQLLVSGASSWGTVALPSPVSVDTGSVLSSSVLALAAIPLSASKDNQSSLSRRPPCTGCPSFVSEPLGLATLFRFLISDGALVGSVPSGLQSFLCLLCRLLAGCDFLLAGLSSRGE
ncbi:unnamed protein product [Acanthoscelides obtectus]|uniref:Uncharacterized protein n=1 Tax=Acanthoscelides obtectus TaxID=200917 RepID=A0A9P0PVF9_ACAOB|nr:unnamed protein product [Acanthoscelides obtectus]CAK1682139.1 hypothetical protein AOBTE_LOCUS33458 [Acanthoscelides obtectus]